MPRSNLCPHQPRMIAKLKVPSKVCPLHLALVILGPLIECVLHLGSMRVA